MNEERKLVPFARVRRRPDRNRMAEFAATARKLQQERSRAADLVSNALARSSSDLASLPELRNAGVVEQLGREVESRLDRSPREALKIAELATAVADALPSDAYPAVMLAQVRAHAWKDLGQALCYLARHEEALAALDKADALLDAFGTLAHDLAIVRFVRATTLQEVNRFDDSLRLLHEARDVFVAHGDARRCLLCGIAQGVLLQRLKRFREARDVFVALLAVADELSDRECTGSIHTNVACAAIELGDFSTAERHLDEAAAIFAELHQPVRAALAELARGRLLTRRGKVDAGIAHLRRVRAELLRHSVTEEAGISGLEIVEALLGADRAHEAEALARQIVREFTIARLNARAITAVGYLQEAIAARIASVATVDRVRQYIRSLRKNPEREFVAAG